MSKPDPLTFNEWSLLRFGYLGLEDEETLQGYEKYLGTLMMTNSNKVAGKTSDKIEKDPHGKLPNEPGAKLDAGKNRVGLMVSGFALALSRVAEVTTYGANKYTPNGWLSVSNGSERYSDAMYRHLLESVNHPIDTETGIEHLAHAAWNILAVLELKLRKELSSPEPHNETKQVSLGTAIKVR